MESKLLAGGKTISVHTAEQEKALTERRRQISLQKARELEIKQKLEANKESASEIQETYHSLQEEVDNKTKKLKKLYHQLQLTKAEIEDHTSEQVISIDIQTLLRGINLITVGQTETRPVVYPRNVDEGNKIQELGFGELRPSPDPREALLQSGVR